MVEYLAFNQTIKVRVLSGKLRLTGVLTSRRDRRTIGLRAIVYMTKFDKKIQYGGWSSDSYKYSRNKINRFLDNDQKNEVDTFKTPMKKFKCKKNKGEHSFIDLEKPKNYIFKRECSACGKLEY